MLLLSRRTNESLVINGNITIKILKQKGGQIRIGITAPQDVSIHIEEAYRKIVKAEGALKSLN